MPTVTPPSINLPAPSASSASSASAPGARGRSTEQPEGRSFGAVLDRSRAASRPAADDAASTASATPGASRKPGRAGERKSDLSAADVMAMLAPLPAHIARAAAGAKSDAVGSASGTTAAGAAHRAASADASIVGAAAEKAGADSASTTPAVTEDADASDDAVPEGAVDATARTGAQASTADAKLQATAASATSTSGAGAHADAAVSETADALMPQQPTAMAAASAASPAKTASAKDAAAGAASNSTSSAPAPIALESAKASTTSALSATTASTDGSALDADTAAPQPLPLPQMQTIAASSDRAAAPAGSTPVLSVAPPVGSDQWGPAIGQQMIRMSASGHHVAELNLNPTGLGPLKVTLTMGDNQAQAMFMSAHESVRKAVEAALPQLRTTLAEQGISLGQTSVGAETRQPFGQGSAFADQNPSRRQQGSPDYSGASRADSAATATRLAPAPATAVRAGAGLDTFA